MHVKAHVAWRWGEEHGVFCGLDHHTEIRSRVGAIDLNPVVGCHDSCGSRDDLGIELGVLASAHDVGCEHMNFWKEQGPEGEGVFIHTPCIGDVLNLKSKVFTCGQPHQIADMGRVNVHHVDHVQSEGGDADFLGPRGIVLQNEGVLQALHEHRIGRGQIQVHPGQHGIVVGIGTFDGQRKRVVGHPARARDLQGHVHHARTEGLDNHGRVAKLNNVCRVGWHTRRVQQRPFQSVGAIGQLVRVKGSGDGDGFSHAQHGVGFLSRIVAGQLKLRDFRHQDRGAEGEISTSSGPAKFNEEMAQ